MALSIDFFYMELLKHQTKGTYIKNNGMFIFEKYGLQVAVFYSMDYRYIATVKYYYGSYSFSEI